MLKIKNNQILTTLVVGAATLSASYSVSAATLTMSNWVPPTHYVTTDILQAWADNVEKATEGRVQIRMLPKPVGSPPQHWELARKGVADVTWGNFTYEPDRFKSVWFAEMPLNGEDIQASGLALWDTYNEYLSTNPAYQGVKLLGVGMLGPGAINHGSKAIANLNDLQNQKIRMGGPIQKQLLEDLGAIPIAAPATKAYELLDSGVIDGSMHPLESVVNFRLTDVLKHHTRVEGGIYDATFFLAMNEAKWNKLSDADKAAIDSVSGEAFARLWGQVFEAQNDAALVKLKEEGHDFSEPSAELVDRLTTIKQQMLDAWAAQGTEYQIADPMAMYNFYRERYAAYAKR